MKTLLIIGIGAGDPDYLTVQAINALNRTDVFFLMDKGSAKDSLIGLRRTLCERFIQGRDYRFVSADCPERLRDVPDYRGSVVDLNQDKQQLFEGMIREQMADGECGAFLVWGDPALYDSTLRIVEQIVRNSTEHIEYEVIPGITSLQALAAKHKVCFNSIGQAFQVTPARRLAEGGFPEGLDSVLVMLDAQDSYRRFVDQDMHIYWGAYIGTADEVLIAGPLSEVAETIHSRRAALREQHGWIMDSYLLRRNDKG
ncbi:precorrin-6A synthase (deacetylating) [Pseudomonas sp.]|uniref:precorrin-6A synthase (deacetylating) n=1 Tax=Pseudomonas sp. TaxID=306 RepID=UPI00299DE627|nr:precorrin-6A synthase (deacetylating) [Pseudomonas sp.]MDX1367498.1 precorrin-6A synthase (deacetylating) [Pseudomonas sp.]